MRILDPHIHCYSRTTTDYENMKLAGVDTVIEPAFWLGSARTHPATFFDYFEHITTYEPTRAARYGIRHYSCIACNPKEANDLELAKTVIDGMGPYLDKPNCVALGEIGFDHCTDAEETILRLQLELAAEKDMVILIHTPHVDKAEGTKRTIKVIEDMGLDQSKIILDHNDESTIEISRDSDCWCGHTIYPFTKLSPERFCDILKKFGTDRMVCNSAADWGPSDPLAIPKTVQVMRHRGYGENEIQKVVFDNPKAFFEQSGKLQVDPILAPQTDEGLAHWVTHNF